MSGKVIASGQVRLHGAATTMAGAVEEAAALLVAAGAVTSDYVGYMFERERIISTYMGNLLAVPHGTTEGKDKILASGISFVRYDEPIDWGGNEVRFVVGVAAKDGGHLEVLAAIAEVFGEQETVGELLAAESAEAVLEILGHVNGR